MLDVKNCCGCTACYAICPKKAIAMEADERGFLQPSIDADACIQCGLCEKVCPMIHSDMLDDKVGDLCYVGRLKDRDELKKSQSGGAFWALAKGVIAQSGVVYGCGYTDRSKAVHKRTETIEACEGFRGSKYVQSDMGDTFSQVKSDLENGRLVLFTGTPCQCAGLRSFLRRSYDRLLVCDVICHGVPSPQITQSYLRELEDRERSKVIHLSYRYYDGEQDQWGSHRERVGLKDGSVVSDDVLAKLFYSHAFMRASCYTCPFCTKVQSDLTIADAWGLMDFLPSYEDPQYGVSEMIIHSRSKRGEIQKMLSEQMDLTEVCYADIARFQPHLHHPVDPDPETDRLWRSIQRKGVFATYQYLYRRKKRKQIQAFADRLWKKCFKIRKPS